MTERTRRGYVTKQITVPGNLAQACEEFNTGHYYECHETLEEIWQEEVGGVRDLYKGLIQVAAAFVHLSRGGYVGAERLLRTSVEYLAPYRADGAMGINVDEICRKAERASRELVSDPANVRVSPAVTPLWTCDETRLPAEALRWRAWGFDAEGRALPMSIQVPDDTS